jgi:signal transduction histidine kinase
MERIIRDVLTLARREGAVDPTPGVELDAVATDAWRTVDTEPATLSFADDLPTIDADADRLRRLFENLFRNAVEHGPAGNDPSATGATEAADTSDGDQSAGGSDGPAARTSPDAGPSVRIRVGTVDDGFYVADDGRGVAPDDRARVFDPGYTDRDGTGLGLTIVERIAVAHGWTVSLEAATDGGARFEFRGVDVDRG